MSILRIVGLIIGIIGLILTFLIYRGPKWRRLNFLLFGIFSLSLVAISLNPNLINNIASILALEQESRGRLLALLIFSNIFLWLLLLYFKNRLDRQSYQFDLLVRSLGESEGRAELEEKLKDKEIMVVIPALNEAENLKNLVKRMPQRIEGKRVGILVIDDGSEDETFSVAKNLGCLVLKNKINRGGGAALRLGYDAVRLSPAKICVTMDADGQHNPEEIEKLIKPILEDKYDFVIGSRILGSYEQVSIFRSVGLRLSNFVVNLLLGTKITDCASGFRAFKTDLLKSVDLREDQYHTSELIIDAVKKNLRIGEVPITILKRGYGKTKKGDNLKYALNFASTILKTWWR